MKFFKKKKEHCHIKNPRTDLPNFFDSLSIEDIDSFLEDYNHCKEFGYETFNADSLKKLYQEKQEKLGGTLYTFKDEHT